MAWSSWVLVLAIVGEASVREREDAAFDLSRADELAGSNAMFARLLAEEPGSARACLWQEGVLLNAIAAGDPPAMWRAAADLIDRWHALREVRGVEALARVCRADVANGLRYLAARWHREGVDECDGERLELAERAYRRFLFEFPDDPAGHEVQYELAMALLARAQQAGPGRACERALCGRAARQGLAERRRRGERTSCGPGEAVAGEPAACPWLRAARVAFVRALELDPHGEHASRAAYGQLVMAAAITNHDEAIDRRCRTHSDGVCVVDPPRGPVCFEPTAACYSHLARPDRWPTAPIGGIGHEPPRWRAP